MERLYRSRDDKIIFGVCGGLSRYFNVDVTLVRLIFVVGVLLKGVTLLIYIILALITPEEKIDAAATETSEQSPTTTAAIPSEISPETERRQKLLAYGLILVGIILFVQEMMPFWLSDSQLLAIILVLIGAALLLKRKEKSD